MPVAKGAREEAGQTLAVVAQVAEPKVDVDARVPAAEPAAVGRRVRARERLRHGQQIQRPGLQTARGARLKREAPHLRAVKALGAPVNHARRRRRLLEEAEAVVLDRAQRRVERAVIVEKRRIQAAVLRAGLVRRHEDAQGARARQRHVVVVLEPETKVLARAALPRPEHAHFHLVREERRREACLLDGLGVCVKKRHDIVDARGLGRGTQLRHKGLRVFVVGGQLGRQPNNKRRVKHRAGVAVAGKQRAVLVVLGFGGVCGLGGVRRERVDVLL